MAGKNSNNNINNGVGMQNNAIDTGGRTLVHRSLLESLTTLSTTIANEAYRQTTGVVPMERNSFEGGSNLDFAVNADDTVEKAKMKNESVNEVLRYWSQFLILSGAVLMSYFVATSVIIGCRCLQRLLHQLKLKWKMRQELKKALKKPAARNRIPQQVLVIATPKGSRREVKSQLVPNFQIDKTPPSPEYYEPEELQVTTVDNRSTQTPSNFLTVEEIRIIASSSTPWVADTIHSQRLK